MSDYLKDLIYIPEQIHKGDFVLSLADGVEKPEQTLADYVVTPQLQDCFRNALAFVRSALESNSSKVTYLHGSFGSGKSHFMAVLDLILSNHKAVRSKPDLQEICAEHSWTEEYRQLLVPYHLIGAESMEQAILGGYARYVRRLHPEAKPPAVYLADALFENAEQMRGSMGDALFFQQLNGEKSADDDSGFGDFDQGWTLEDYLAAQRAPVGHPEWSRLVGDLVATLFSSYATVASGSSAAYLPLDQGLSVISHHAASLGYQSIILFLDELVLWLASRAGDPGFVHREGQKLAKLIEAQEASRPVPLISFVARQRTLQDLLGENVTGHEKANYDDALRHWSGRFHTIELEDVNLPDIVAGRVLKPLSPQAEAKLDEAFHSTAAARQEVMEVLLTSHGDREMFRKVYPFSPALIETLVAASALLQRNRTAIKALMELLVAQRDTLTLGHLIPVGDLFDIVSQGEEVFTPGLREHFDNAKRLYHERFRPLLEAKYGLPEQQALATLDLQDPSVRGFRNDARLVKTLLLAALVPGVESFQSLTPQRLAALNHGTIKTRLPGQEASMVLKKLREWSSQVGELRISEGDNPIISLQLVGVDVERILEPSRHMDNAGNRKKKIRELLAQATGISTEDLDSRHTVLWRGTEHTFPVEFSNVREKTTDALRSRSDSWKLLIDYPFDEPGFFPRDDLGKLEEFTKQGEGSRTLVWLPQFFAAKVQTDLGRLITFDHVLSGDNFKEATRHLSPQDIPQARGLLENQRNALRNRLQRVLEMAYGVSSSEPEVLNSEAALEPSEQFQSLWPGFALRPPVASSLKQAVDHLLKQALEHQFPGHPDFPVESRITKAQVQSVWEVLKQLPEAGGARLEVPKNLRSRVGALAEPLRLGKMSETHFVPTGHWPDHFDKKIHLEGLLEPTVADLDRWMDDPEPSGLPNELRDLVVLLFASRTNRSFRLHGAAYSPNIGSVRREAQLVVQPLPDQRSWDRARELLSAAFGVQATPLLNADTVSRLADGARERANAHLEALQALPGELSDKMVKLGLDPEQSPRLQLARQARALARTVLAQERPKEMVEAVAALPLQATPAELKASVDRAQETLNKLSHTRMEVFSMLGSRASPESASVGAQLLERLAQAFRDHEFVTRLAPALTQAVEQAWALVPKGEPPVAPPSPPKGDRGAGRRRVRERKELTGLGPAQAAHTLEQLKAQLGHEVRLDLSWTLWDSEPEPGAEPGAEA